MLFRKLILNDSNWSVLTLFKMIGLVRIILKIRPLYAAF